METQATEAGRDLPTARRESETAVVTRPDERRSVTVPGNPMSYQVLSPEGVPSMVMIRASAAPGQTTGAVPLRHGGDEMLYMVAGTMEAEVSGITHRLGPGDTIFIPRGHAHRFTNVGTEPAEAVFVLSPPAY